MDQTQRWDRCLRLTMHSNNNTFKLASQQPTEIHKPDLSSEQQGCTLDLPRMGETKSAQLKELVGRRCVSRGVGSLLPCFPPLLHGTSWPVMQMRSGGQRGRSNMTGKTDTKQAGRCWWVGGRPPRAALKFFANHSSSECQSHSCC